MTFRKMLFAPTWRYSIPVAIVVVIGALMVSIALMAANLGLFGSGSSQNRMYRIEFPGPPGPVDSQPEPAPVLGSPAAFESQPVIDEVEKAPVGAAGRKVADRGESPAPPPDESSELEKASTPASKSSTTDTPATTSSSTSSVDATIPATGWSADDSVDVDPNDSVKKRFRRGVEGASLGLAVNRSANEGLTSTGLADDD